MVTRSNEYGTFSRVNIAWCRIHAPKPIQFNRKWEKSQLQTALATLTTAPHRDGYHRHLLDLLSFRVSQQPKRG